MKLYAVVETRDCCDGDKTVRLIGASQFEKDATYFAATHNDYVRKHLYMRGYDNTLDGYELYKVVPLDSDKLNLPNPDFDQIKILYRFIFDKDGELLRMWDDGLTLMDYKEIREEKLHSKGKESQDVYYMQIALSNNISEETIKKIATDEIKNFINNQSGAKPEREMHAWSINDF